MALSNFQSSPGVYVTEIDLSQRVETSSTTIGVVVGASKKGPVNERSLITSTQEFIKAFGPPDASVSMMHYSALAFLEDSGTLYVTRVLGEGALWAGAYLTVDDPTAEVPIIRLTNFDDGSSNPKGINDPLKNLDFSATDAATKNTLMYICAANPGEWNNRLSIQIRPSNSIGVAVGVDHDVYDFHIDVFEDYQGPRDQPVESWFVSRENKVDGYGRQLFVEDVNRKSNYIRVRNNPYCDKVAIKKTAFEFLAGGENGALPTSYDIIDGWNLYTDTEQLDVSLLINAGYVAPEIQYKMNEVAQLRKDCVALLDIPSDMQQTADAVTYRKEILNLDSNSCALYTPDVKIKDPYNDIELFVPLSGFAAAICARTDHVGFLWNAPAGLNRGLLTVLGVRHVYNQAARDALDSAQINMLRYFPNGMGIAMWAQNTMQTKASALSNLNVRRLLNYLEKRISNMALYSVFETNDRDLRGRLVSMIDLFLRPIKNNRGLLDFKVVCDETNNPPSIVASGDLILDVYLDPTLPAKLIHLNASITKTGVIFRETLLNTSAMGLAV